MLTLQARRLVLIGFALVLAGCESPFAASHSLLIVDDISVPAVLPRDASGVVSFQTVNACNVAPEPTVQRTPGNLTVAIWERDRPRWALAVSEVSNDASTSPCFGTPRQSVALVAFPQEQVIVVRIRQPDGADYVRVVRVAASAR